MARGPKASADRYFSELIRARGNSRCERCGCISTGLQAAHIIRRRHVGDPDGTPLRHNEDNAWALCGTCHYRVDTDPVAFTALVDATIGRAMYEELIRIKNAPHRRWTDKDWARERDRLRERLKEL